jgi:thiosulfate/3-mercaptopyruvate sulfurtransferase
MALDPLISPVELRSLVEARAAAHEQGSDVVLLDCRAGAQAEAEYAAGHLPGALRADLERDLAAPTATPQRGGRHPLPDAQRFAETLGRWSITPASRVVAYDDQAGANAAARLWWMLRAFGHERVQVLDGGLQAALAAGMRLSVEARGSAREQNTPAPAAQPAYPATAFAWPTADIEEVEHARRAPERRLLDVRAAFRFRGEGEPIDPIAGHIPGALNLPFSENLESGRFKPAAELRALYERSVLRSAVPEQLIVHCGSGVTACHALLALERAGLHGAKLYVGSWSEWCRNPERAREP